MCTEYRKKCITAAMLARVREMAATRCTGWGGSLLEFNGEADHVYLLVALPPNLDLSRFVNNLKTTSSRLLRKEFADRLKAGPSQARILVPLVVYHHVWRGPLSIQQQYIEQQRSPE
jgi:putative transposase